MLVKETEKSMQMSMENDIINKATYEEVEAETKRREKIQEEKEFYERKRLESLNKPKTLGAVGEGEMITCLDGQSRIHINEEKSNQQPCQGIHGRRSGLTSLRIRMDLPMEGPRQKDPTIREEKQQHPTISLQNTTTRLQYLLQRPGSIHPLRQRDPLNESNHVHAKVIVGQLINRADRSLEDVFDHLEQSEYGEILIPRVACQAHEENLIHGRLGLDCIWLTSNDCIRISDWFITGRLAKFAEEWDHLVKDCKPKVLSRHGSSTETENGSGDCQVYGRSTKADLVNLGRVFRKNVLQVTSSGTLQQKEIDLNNFIQEYDKVKSIDQLCNHNFLTMPRSWFPGASKKEIEDLTKFDNDWLRDFFLISYLGKGGFGEVLLANN
uniref:Protein kinase domain-containing protein n=1 Tax=Strongyloides papillosus TaxID=174720 RepID=A0A0N5BBU1_STREA